MNRNKEQRSIEKIYRRNTSLGLYILDLFLEMFLNLMKFVPVLLFPYLISLLSILIAFFFSYNFTFDASLTWAIFGIVLSLDIGIYSTIISLSASKKCFYRKTPLKIFASLKLFKLIPYTNLWIFSLLYIIYSLFLIAEKSPISLLEIITSSIYAVITLICFIIFLAKNEKKQYIAYLRSNKILKRATLSGKKDRSLVFQKYNKSIEKFLNFKNKVFLVEKMRLGLEIEEFYGDVYISSENHLFNLRLLEYYFEEVDKHNCSDMDIIVFSIFLKTINDIVIDKIISLKKYDVLERLLSKLDDSAFRLICQLLKSLESKEFLNYLKYAEENNIFDPKYINFISTYNDLKINIIKTLFDSVSDIFNKIGKIKTNNNKHLNSIKATLLPKYNKYVEQKKTAKF